MDAWLAAIWEFVRRPTGTFVIGPLHDAIREALRTDASVALLSWETMAKQAQSHADLQHHDYLLIPLALADPTLIAAQRDRHIVLFRAGTKVLRVAAKTTEDRREVYVTSFHFTDLRKAQQFLRHNPVQFGEPATLSD